MFLMSNRQSLSNWLQAELNARDWTQSDLARVSGLHRAIISKIILGGSKPQPETLEAIAKALKLPPEQIYRAAGILPAPRETDEWVEEMSHKLNLIPPGLRTVAGKFIDSMVQAEEADQQKPKSKPKPAKA